MPPITDLGAATAGRQAGIGQVTQLPVTCAGGGRGRTFSNQTAVQAVELKLLLLVTSRGLIRSLSWDYPGVGQGELLLI